MRAIAEIQSLNWRMILVITICFMGFYFLIVDEGSQGSQPGEGVKNPKAVTPIHRPSKPTVVKPGEGKKEVGIGKGKENVGVGKDEWKEVKVESKVKTEWDDRFEGVAPVENPYPVLGDQYDSPFDAIPGRLRPGEGGEENLELAPEPVAQPEKPKEKPNTKPAKAGPKQKEKKPIPTPESFNEKPNANNKDQPQPPSEHAKALQSKAASLPLPSLTPEPTQFSPEEQQAKEDYNYIAICAALKNVPLDLPEWLIHHYNHLGIHHFYIMDDGSNPPLSTIPTINLGVPPGAVHFDYQDQSRRGKGHSQQLLIYQRCLEMWGSRHKWMVFIDGDEFLEMTAGNETLFSFLKEKEQEEGVGAVAVNWRMHTSSGLLTRPESVRKAFTECIWDGPRSNNSHVKSIVRTDVGVRPSNPHLWFLEEGYRTVGEAGDVVESEAFRVPVGRGRIALHHYAGKSREEYEEKMGRGNAMDGMFFSSSSPFFLGSLGFLGFLVAGD